MMGKQYTYMKEEMEHRLDEAENEKRVLRERLEMITKGRDIIITGCKKEIKSLYGDLKTEGESYRANSHWGLGGGSSSHRIMKIQEPTPHDQIVY